MNYKIITILLVTFLLNSSCIFDEKKPKPKKECTHGDIETRKMYETEQSDNCIFETQKRECEKNIWKDWNGSYQFESCTQTNSSSDLIAKFHTINSSGSVPLNITFYNDSVGVIDLFQWDFDNDGIIDSYEENPTYTYNNEGTYTVKLTIKGKNNSDEIIKTNLIFVSKKECTNGEIETRKMYETKQSDNCIFETQRRECEKNIWKNWSGSYQFESCTPNSSSDFLAKFHIDNSSGNAPLNVTFYNDSVGVIDSFQWDFDNDGIIDSFEKNPTHIYNREGTYTVKLTIKGSSNSNEIIKINLIVVSKNDPSQTSINENFKAIPLTIINSISATRKNEPISYGIPFSFEDAIFNEKKLIVSKDSKGKNIIQSQFDVISRYNGPKNDATKPIRSVLCTFYGDIDSLSNSTYYLLELKNSAQPKLNMISNDNSAFTIDTGILKISIDKLSGFKLFDNVYLNEKKIVSTNNQNGIILIRNNNEYKSSNQLKPDKFEVEYNGPIKAVLAIHGELLDKNKKSLIPSGYYFGIKYTTRITAFKNKSYIVVQTTIKNENIGYVGHLMNNHNQNIDVDRLFLRTSLNVQNNNNKIIKIGNFSKLNASGNWSIFQDHKEKHLSSGSEIVDGVDNFEFQIKKGNTTKITGERFNDHASLIDQGNSSITLSARWFWQNWPKAISLNADNGEAIFDLLPNISEKHIIRGGTWKTNDIIFNFGDGNDQVDQLGVEALNVVKNKLIIFTDNMNESRFMDTFPSENMSTDYVFAGGEKLQKAVSRYFDIRRILFQPSKYPGNYSSVFDFREKRRIKWSSKAPSKIAGKPINWYGWMDFGGLVRDSAGFGSLNYEWVFASAMVGMQYKDPNIILESEIMARHYGDMLIIHSPIDSNSTIYSSSGGIYIENAHGGQRPENASDDRYYDFLKSWMNNSVGQYCHSAPRGSIMQYILTGDGHYREMIEDITDHLKKNYSGYKPGHAQARSTSSSKNCTENHACWVRTETRQWVRAIAAAVDVWKATGDIKMLNTAKGIFKNALLNVERNINGVKKGYLDDSDSVHMFYQVLSMKPIIHLYRACQIDNDTELMNEIKNFLIRHAKWVRDDVYSNWHDGNGNRVSGGTYNSNKTKYFPYAIMNAGMVNEGSSSYPNPWPREDKPYAYANSQYSRNYADLFAIVSELTGDDSWFELARGVFKDGMVYGGGKWENIYNNTDFIIRSINETYSAWLKKGMSITKPLYFLKMEENKSRKSNEN